MKPNEPERTFKGSIVEQLGRQNKPGNTQALVPTFAWPLDLAASKSWASIP